MNTAVQSPDNIPDLADAQRLLNVPPRLAVALDARAMEKALVTQLVAQWLAALRPEMERMAQQIVQRSAEDYWRQHATDRPADGPEFPR